MAKKPNRLTVETLKHEKATRKRKNSQILQETATLQSSEQKGVSPFFSGRMV